MKALVGPGHYDDHIWVSDEEAEKLLNDGWQDAEVYYFWNVCVADMERLIDEKSKYNEV